MFDLSSLPIKLKEYITGNDYKNLTNDEKTRVDIVIQEWIKNNIYNSKHSLSEETKQKMREKKMGQLNPMYGKKVSDEVKQRISLTMTGRKRHPFSEQTKEKMRIARLNYYKNKNGE